MERKQIIQMLKNACHPYLYELRDEVGFNDYEKALFTQRYIKDNFVEKVIRLINCGKTKYHKDHNRILAKINSYIEYKANFL